MTIQRSCVCVFKLLVIIAITIPCSAQKQKKNSGTGNRFITVSRYNPAYFSFTDGTVYIPVGINMINPSGNYESHPDSAFYEIEQWMKNLSANGGNYIRIWLSHSFWDIEEETGRYSEQKAKRIDRFIEMARKYHLRIKLTLEHFRSVTLEENPQRWATKFAYHKTHGGPLDSVYQYLSTAKGEALFLNKLDYYQKRYGSDTLFFGWELWNEMNAMHVPQDSVFIAWNKKMLLAVKQKFPEHLVMQSLGSFDGDYVRPLYQQFTAMPGNEVAQVHRYLDPGAKLEVCHGSMDQVCASAVKELLSYKRHKPVLLAETGAVEAHHAGPSKLYPKDTAGILLHDIIFAPFFSGAAGTGMSWHWDSYVHKNNLWYHYGRFNEAVKGTDPVHEAFIPSYIETAAVRVYLLKGRTTTLIWVRDKNSNWESELEQGIAPRLLQESVIDLHVLGIKGVKAQIKVYDPWKNTWTKILNENNMITLPDFKRSLVVRIN